MIANCKQLKLALHVGVATHNGEWCATDRGAKDCLNRGLKIDKLKTCNRVRLVNKQNCKQFLLPGCYATCAPNLLCKSVSLRRISAQKKEYTAMCILFLVPLIGVEPIRCCHRGILSPLRLPIPPQWRALVF